MTESTSDGPKPAVPAPKPGVEDDAAAEVTEEPATQASNHPTHGSLTETDPDGTMEERQ